MRLPVDNLSSRGDYPDIPYSVPCDDLPDMASDRKFDHDRLEAGSVGVEQRHYFGSFNNMA